MDANSLTKPAINFQIKVFVGRFFTKQITVQLSQSSKKNTQTKNYKIVLTLMPTLVTPLQLALLRLLLLCTIL
jgi:hypothetical protein